MNNEDYGDGMVDALTDSVLAVMERIDEMEQPQKVAWVESVATVPDIERSAMIKALRWAANNATCGHTLCSGIRVLADEVRRLENGGEL